MAYQHTPLPLSPALQGCDQAPGGGHYTAVPDLDAQVPPVCRPALRPHLGLQRGPDGRSPGHIVRSSRRAACSVRPIHRCVKERYTNCGVYTYTGLGLLICQLWGVFCVRRLINGHLRWSPRSVVYAIGRDARGDVRLYMVIIGASTKIWLGIY